MTDTSATEVRTRTQVRNRTRVLGVIGIGGIAAAFFAGFVVPLPYRIATFHPWLTGDWLIDYSAGFVRRGFYGALLNLLNLDAVQSIGAIALTQFVFAGALFTLVGILFWRTTRSPAWIMLVLSPAFLLFPVLDPDASGRKELIVLVALAMVALGFSNGRTILAATMALPVYVLAVLSHEVAAVTLPAFLFLIIFSEVGNQRAKRALIAGYSLVAGLGLLAAFIFRGDTNQVDLLCGQWIDRGIPGCDGALQFLSQTPAQTQEYLLAELFPTYWGYLIPAALALIPLITLRLLPAQWVIAIVILATAAPLFLISWDYGRWIYLITAQLSLIALALARTNFVRPMRVPLIIAAAYVLLWGMEHVSQPLTQGVLVRWFEQLT